MTDNTTPKQKRRWLEKDSTAKLLKGLAYYSATFELEKSTPYGKIDVFVTDPLLAIIEVKRGSRNTYAHSALGQLLFYHQYYPDAALFAYFSQELPSRYAPIFSSHGIYYDWKSFSHALYTAKFSIKHVHDKDPFAPTQSFDPSVDGYFLDEE